jgi:hypothetical protein
MKQFLFFSMCSLFVGCNAQTHNNNVLKSADIIQFFKGIEYTTIPYSNYIKEIKQADEHTTVYEFDFSKVDSDSLVEKFGTSLGISNKFTVMDGKIVYAEYETVVGRTATEGVLTNLSDGIIVKEVSGGVFMSSAITYKNGKKISEVEFQDDDQKARGDYLSKMDFSNIKISSGINTHNPKNLSPSTFIGKWASWNELNKCDDIIEVTSTGKNKFSGTFYPECYEDGGVISDQGYIEGDKLIFPKEMVHEDLGFGGATLYIEGNNLIELRNNEKSVYKRK